MTSKRRESKRDVKVPKQGKVEIRKDLQDASRGKDLSYLNEMPQMGGYEGVKAGAPPPKKETGENEANKKRP
jgi:hypothetical protein